MICVQNLIVFALLWTLFGPLNAINNGLVTDCNNITITASEYLINTNTIVDIDGTCTKTNSDAVDGVVVYGSALEILSNCSGEVVSNNIIFTFRFYINGSIQLQETADEFLIQCEVSTQTLLNSTWDYQLEPFSRTSGHSTANATISNPLIALSVPRTKYNVGDFVDVEILSTSTADGLKIRAQRCWASPTSAGTTTYDLLLNRCPSDPTAKLTVDSDLKSTLRFEAFTFLSSPNSIYLECEVIMCLASTVDSRCDLCSSKRKRRRDIEDIDTSGYHRIRSKSFFVIPKPIYSEKEIKRNFYQDKMKSPCKQNVLDEINVAVFGLSITSLTMLVLLASTKRHFDYSNSHK